MATVSEFTKMVRKPGRFLYHHEMDFVQYDIGDYLEKAVGLSAPTIGTMVDLYAKVELRSPNESIKVPLKNNYAMMHISEMYGQIESAEKEFNFCMELIHSPSFRMKMRGYRILTMYEQLNHLSHSYWMEPTHIHQISDDDLLHLDTLCKRTMHFFKKELPQQYYISEAPWDDVLNDTIHRATLDLMGNDTIWDLKVSRSKPTSAHRLQILMYYVLAKQSNHPVFKDIRYIGLFNPYLNISCKYDMHDYDENRMNELLKLMNMHKN